MKKLIVMACCISLIMLLCSCNENEIQDTIPIEKPGNEASVPAASLTYELTCDKELTDFVTAEITYCDSLGEHSVMLEDKDWEPTTYALCYKTENDTTIYSSIEVDENGNVPEPWIVQSYKTILGWGKEVFLNRLGLVNNCTLKFHRKDDYRIETDKKYALTYSFRCSEGYARAIVDGKAVYLNYIDITHNIGGKTSWSGYEVEDYLDELCSKTFTESMSIGSDGTISKKSN